MKKRYIISFVVAIIILSVLFLWNVGAGSVDISTSDLFAILAGSGKDETFSQIVWKIRLPRILAAILLGGALSVSGFLLQSFFQQENHGKCQKPSFYVINFDDPRRSHRCNPINPKFMVDISDAYEIGSFPTKDTRSE